MFSLGSQERLSHEHIEIFNFPYLSSFSGYDACSDHSSKRGRGSVLKRLVGYSFSGSAHAK
jgi:hypothetical protein